MPYCKTPTDSVARPPLGSEPPPSGRIPRLRHGLKPITLEGGLMEEVTGIARKYAECSDQTKIPRVSYRNTKRRESARAADATEQYDPIQIREAKQR
jgi:hypothetical protein